MQPVRYRWLQQTNQILRRIILDHDLPGDGLADTERSVSAEGPEIVTSIWDMLEHDVRQQGGLVSI